MWILYSHTYLISYLISINNFFESNFDIFYIIGPIDLSILKGRSEVIDFALPIQYVYNALFIPNPGGALNYGVYTNCYTTYSWMALILGFWTITACLYLSTAQ